MANRRVIVKRRKAVRNIRKITRTMQLIATARFQATFRRATATKPYTKKLAELVASLVGPSDELKHPLMETPEDVNKSELLVLTSNRGLCGGYNANILRGAVKHLDQARDEGIETDVQMVGKKGINYFKFLGRPVAQMITDIDHLPPLRRIEPIATGLMERFTKGEIASAHVAYMRFVSTGVQRPMVIQLLPFAHEKEENTEESGTRAVEFEFSPKPAELLDELLPASVRVRLFQCFMDASVSEQVARMVAMKGATDAAGDMITSLTRQYNRARQTAITMELLDIVGGANALAD